MADDYLEIRVSIQKIVRTVTLTQRFVRIYLKEHIFSCQGAPLDHKRR